MQPLKLFHAAALCLVVNGEMAYRSGLFLISTLSPRACVDNNCTLALSLALGPGPLLPA